MHIFARSGTFIKFHVYFLKMFEHNLKISSKLNCRSPSSFSGPNTGLEELLANPLIAEHFSRFLQRVRPELVPLLCFCIDVERYQRMSIAICWRTILRDYFEASDELLTVGSTGVEDAEDKAARHERVDAIRALLPESITTELTR